MFDYYINNSNNFPIVPKFTLWTQKCQLMLIFVYRNCDQVNGNGASLEASDQEFLNGKLIH